MGNNSTYENINRYQTSDGRTFEFERDAMDYQEITGKSYQDTFSEDYDWRYTGEMGG